MTEYHTFVDFVLHTKLIEYAVAFLFIGLFAIFYKLIQAPAVPEMAAEAVVSRAYDRIKGFLVPEGLYYHQGHTWARAEGDGLAAVGVDDFAAKLVGDIAQVQLPEVGTTLRQGERAWTLVVDGKAVDMLSPIDGEVVSVNQQVAETAEKINEDPYQEGWLLKVESPKVNSNFKNLLSGLLARQWTEQAVETLLTRSNVEMGAVAGDGGLPINGMAREIDAQNWDQLARELFLTD